MYNPFINKRISELTENDLNDLIERQVAEGQYVEYKQDCIEARKIAKSISSFANSYGGWLFIGITADNITNTPVCINGLDISACGNLSDTIRNAVISHLDPQPVYREKLILLKSNRAVMLIRIEEGIEPPYIHSDGRIYRRQGAGSDPVFEKDRHFIDQLYNKAEKADERFRQFAVLPWEICEDQYEYFPGWIEIYAFPEEEVDVDPDAMFVSPNETLEWWNSKFRFFYDENNKDNYIDAYALFDRYQESFSGYYISQILKGLNANWIPLMIEAHFDGKTRALIPIKKLSESKESLVKNELEKTWGDSVFDLRIFDGDYVIKMIFVFLLMCVEYAKKCGVERRMRVSFRLNNFLHSVPFFSSKVYRQFVEDFGWPIMRQNQIEIPSEKNIPFIPMNANPTIEEVCVLPLVIMRSFGIPSIYGAEIFTSSIQQ